jgi:capsular exopolysaccharide synthesis family protein
LFTNRKGASQQVIVVTSATAGEGKTTVACNIAIAVARLNRRVLLIDGDTEMPRLHTIFGYPNQVGLVDVLESQKPGAALEQYLRDTGVSNLWLLPSGPGSPGTSSVLVNYERLPEVIDSASRQFDTVVIDTPPLLQLADARVFGRHADGVVLVARAGRTRLDALLAAKRRLDDDGTSLLGTVLNDWDPKANVGGYYGQY